MTAADDPNTTLESICCVCEHPVDPKILEEVNKHYYDIVAGRRTSPICTRCDRSASNACEGEECKDLTCRECIEE